jgi:hypothetical protein
MIDPFRDLPDLYKMCESAMGVSIKRGELCEHGKQTYYEYCGHCENDSMSRRELDEEQP